MLFDLALFFDFIILPPIVIITYNNLIISGKKWLYVLYLSVLFSMNSNIIPIIITSLSGLSTMLGIILTFIKPKKEQINKFITFCLSFSFSIMLGISVFELFPTAFQMLIKNISIKPVLGLIILTFSINILLLYIIRKIKFFKEEKGSGKLYRLGVLSMLVLMLHNIPEGIATFISSYADITMGIKLSLGIMLHNIPEGISIAVPIYYASKKRWKATYYTFLAAIAEPLGAVIVLLFLKRYITSFSIGIILLFVGELMIIFAIEEIFPNANSYGENKYMLWGIIIGIIIIMFSTII